jgi:hypothetical protein
MTPAIGTLPHTTGVSTFSQGTLASRGAATTVGATFMDEFGTVWVADGTRWLLHGGAIPMVHARLANSTVSIPNSVSTPVEFNFTDLSDNWAMHDHASGTASVRASFVLPYDGIWNVSAHLSFSTQAAGVRRLYLKRGSTFIMAWHDWPINEAEYYANITVPIIAGTYQFHIYQTSGAALNLGPDDAAGEEFTRACFTMVGSYI